MQENNMEGVNFNDSWNWGLPSLDSKSSFESDEEEVDDTVQGKDNLRSPVTVSRRLSLPAYPTSTLTYEFPKMKSSAPIISKLSKVREDLMVARNEFLELRQEANDLQEYSSAKIARVTRYLGVLAEKARKLDEVTMDYEHRLALLRREKRIQFNDWLAMKGNTRIFVRLRPLLGDEVAADIRFPDEHTLCIQDISIASTSLEYYFDQVYGPETAQGDVFQGIQPLVQSALDGYNVCIFACGQRASGKTYTMEGPSHDRGLYSRAFEELFDLSNAESTPLSSFSFYMSMLQVHGDEADDLLLKLSSHPIFSEKSRSVQLDCSGKAVEVVQQRIDNPSDFARVFKFGLQNQSACNDDVASKNGNLIVTFHIYYSSNATAEKRYSKLSLIDMAGDTAFGEGNGSAPVNITFSELLDVVSASRTMEDYKPFGKSMLMEILSDSIGGESKSLIIINLSPSKEELTDALPYLQLGEATISRISKQHVPQKESEASQLKHDVSWLRKSLKESEDQCLLLFNEVQKAWKVAFTLQQDLGVQKVQMNKLKVQGVGERTEKQRLEKEQINQLKTQVAQLIKLDRDQKAELSSRAVKIHSLEAKIRGLEKQISDSKAVLETKIVPVPDAPVQDERDDDEDSNLAENVSMNLEEELSKRDDLIERLHEENEKLFERLTERKSSSASPKVIHPEPDRNGANFILGGSSRNDNSKISSPHKQTPSHSEQVLHKVTSTALQIRQDRVKTTPAGEYLTAALMDFDPDQYNGVAAVADAANKLLMLVLAAVIKAGATREHEMLEEIRDSVFTFIRRIEPRKVMDTMLVSRVRILYLRSLLSRTTELKSFKAPSVNRFLAKSCPGASGRRSSSGGSSPLRSPVSRQLQSTIKADESIEPFKLNLKQERTSKLSSIVLKIRGIDQETWRQHLTGAKLRETNEEARSYATGNKRLAALFVHTPAGELQRQIRNWLSENFDFLSIIGTDNTGASSGQLELLSTAIMDGWMAGLGIPTRPSTDALGQLLSEYTKHVYLCQLQHLKDLAATLATEEAEDLAQAAKIRSALESIDHKRRKILQQMRTDVALLTKEEGGSPLRTPSAASEEARVASLISLEDILKEVLDIRKEFSHRNTVASKRKLLLSRLNALVERTPSLLSIDLPCAQKSITEVRKALESILDRQGAPYHSRSRRSDDFGMGEMSSSSGDWGDISLSPTDGEVVQWSVLQFNNGSGIPFTIKCGASSSLQLVVKAQAKLSNSTGKEIVSVVPMPSTLAGLSLEEIKDVLSHLPEAFSQLVLARTADGTRARYTRLYKTLVVRVPALRNSASDVDLSRNPKMTNLRRDTSDSEYYSV